MEENKPTERKNETRLGFSQEPDHDEKKDGPLVSSSPSILITVEPPQEEKKSIQMTRSEKKINSPYKHRSLNLTQVMNKVHQEVKKKKLILPFLINFN